MSLILLREQPGVEQLEWDAAEQGWTDELEDRANALAIALFGVCDDDTQLMFDERGLHCGGRIITSGRFDEANEYGDHFKPLHVMRDEADAFWHSVGWDVTDSEGRQLKVMDYLGRPLLCAVKGIHTDARFTGADDAWAKSLEQEAARFRGKAR